MKVYVKNCILTAILVAVPAAAYAQRRVPATGSGAVGACSAAREFFASRTTSVKAEVKCHIIRDIGLTNPDGLALMIGLKKYF